MPQQSQPKLVIAVTSGISQALLRGQLAYAREEGFDVHLLTSPDHDTGLLTESEGAELLPVSME